MAAGKGGRNMRSLTIGAFGFGTAMVLVAVSPTLAWAAIAMGIVGYFSVSFTAHTNTILQTVSSAKMRGRVMALWAMAFIGSTVIGAPVIGWVGQQAGPRWSLIVGAAAALAAGAVGLISTRTHTFETAELPTADRAKALEIA